MKLAPDIRGVFRKLVKKGLAIKDIAYYFDTTRQTVHRWLSRGKHRGKEAFHDKPRQPKESKVTADVEVSILKLRSTFKWGTARIQQGIFKLPSFMTDTVPIVQGVRLSRETINRVLTAHGVNGYSHEYERWKFFRAKEPDELWQIDFKGPFSVQGKKYWFLVCIDDYSRFLAVAEQFDHDPTTKDVTGLLERQKRKPKQILSDHGKQFKEEWKKWCKMHGVEPLYAHPSYPQDKGKVERCIQNLNREFINPLRKFPGWLKGNLRDYRDWFNHSRYHRGVKAFPADLYRV
jgi:IS30 family transposase